MKRSRGRHVTRRRFLKGAAAAAAAPYVITGFGSARGANDRIALGSIGLGGMGSGDNGHLRRNMQCVAVCDVDSRNLEKAKQRVGGGCAGYKDFRELLARPDIDVVSIGTPDHWHAIMAIQAAKAGKDIYCQKPLSLTIKEARAMVKAVRRYGRVFQTGSQQRSQGNGVFRRACEYVRSGRIGKLQSIHIKIGGPSGPCHLPAEPTPDWIDWDMWLGPAPWRPYNKKLHPFSWRPYRDYSGGQTTDWGAHHFDIAQWALGMDDVGKESGPVEIYPPGWKEYSHLTFKYANGVMMYKDNQGPGVRFVGPDGRIDVYRQGLTTEPKSIMQEPLGASDVHLRKSPGHYADFAECVRSRKRPICDVEIGCRSVTVCHLANIAYWLKRPLKWDPVKEEIVGDPGANRWLDRSKRAPWTL